MKRVIVQSLLSSLFITPFLAQTLSAQTSIGGGTCTTSTLSAAYAVSFAGHQDVSGSYTNVMQADGLATFDGKGNATLKLTQDNLSGTGLPLNWSGTYTVQSDCAAQVTVTTGGNAILHLALFAGGAHFLLVGDDETFVYIGQGDMQPAAACSTASLDGVYTFSARGYATAGAAVSGAFAISGLAQFDGKGNVTITSTFAQGTATGTYSLSSNCLGTATIGVGASNMTMALSVYTASAAAATDLYMDVTVSGNLGAGAAHAAYGQPPVDAEAGL